MWYSAIGCISTMLIGVIVSFLTGFQEPADLDHDLLSPPVSRLLGPNKPKHHSGIHALGVTNLALEMDIEKLKNERNGRVEKPKI